MAGWLSWRLTAALLCASCLLACAKQEFEPPSKVEGLRILGLSSSEQVVQPDDPISLDALWVDSRSDANSQVITAWFPGCINPDFSSLEECQDDLNDLRSAPGQAWPAEFSPTSGSRLDTQVSSDILTGRKDFGLQYYFFAACRGSRFEFSPSKHKTVPIICRDAQGRTVRQRDLRLGFRTVTAVPDVGKLPTANPLITGFDFDGQVLAPHCQGSACQGFQQPDCATATCPQIEVIKCKDDEEKDDDCDGGRFRVLVDEASISTDWLFGKDDGGLQSVEVSARYFVTRGELHRDSDLLHEREPIGAQDKWDRESQSGLLSTGETFLWAVVYDSLGGVSWAGIGVDVRPPTPASP